MSAPLISTAELSAVARRDELTGPWFDALAAGRLTLRTCEGCGHVSRPDTAACPACHSEVLRWTLAAGTGVVVSLVRDHSPVRDGGTPISLGLVELVEGPWLHVRLLDNPQVGDRVTLVVLAPAEGEPVPAFRPA